VEDLKTKTMKGPGLQLIREVKEFLRSLQFQELFIQANPKEFEDFYSWAFLPGMLFKAKKKWWAEGERSTPHEGIDLCLFYDKKGSLLKLPATIKIPAPCDGVFLAAAQDFLGITIFFAQSYKNKLTILWAFGHMELEGRLAPHEQIKKGQLLGSISAQRPKNPRMLPHLHISIAIPLSQNLLEEPSWRNLSDTRLSRLVNPLLIFKRAQILNWIPPLWAPMNST